MFCPKCGNQVVDNLAFCPKCGQQISVSSAQVNNSSNNDFSVFPEELHGFSFGAAFLTFIWGIFNKVWISFLVFVPILGWVWWVVLGIKGREWAWKNGNWRDRAHFVAVQKKWDIAGAIVFALSIVLIGLMSSLSVVALNGARTKARDARRVADVKQVQTALELYFNDLGEYPAVVNFDGNSSLRAKGVTYMTVLPKNIQASDSKVCPSDYNYVYKPSTDSKGYTLTYCLEEKTAGIKAGYNTANPAGVYMK